MIFTVAYLENYLIFGPLLLEYLKPRTSKNLPNWSHWMGVCVGDSQRERLCAIEDVLLLCVANECLGTVSWTRLQVFVFADNPRLSSHPVTLPSFHLIITKQCV